MAGIAGYLTELYTKKAEAPIVAPKVEQKKEEEAEPDIQDGGTIVN